MFLDPQGWLSIRPEGKSATKTDPATLPNFPSPIKIPIYVQTPSGNYKKHLGQLGISGFSIEGADPLEMGSRLNVRIVLAGLSVMLETSGKVVAIEQGEDSYIVTVRFITDPLPDEMIEVVRRWLDLFSTDYREVERQLSKMTFPIWVRIPDKSYKKHYGRVGLEGFSVEVKDPIAVGKRIDVRIVLFGMGVMVEISGGVLAIKEIEGGFVAIARYIDNPPSDEIRSAISRWLVLVNDHRPSGDA